MEMAGRFRSVLYVPASNERAMAKAAGLDADALILDLEDAVHPDLKAEARERARGALESGTFTGKSVIVRINGFESLDEGMEFAADDLAAIVPAGADAILVPKIRTVADVERAQSAIDHHFAPETLALWLMVETPQAALALPAIAALAAESGSRLAGLVLGTNDLAKEMRLPALASRLPLLSILSGAVLAARAHGLVVLDGVFGAIGDAAGFESEALQARGLGFDGKTLIHPSQIEPANRIFAPSAPEIAEAEAIVAAFEAPENAGKGVLVVGGRMTERLHYEIARRVLSTP